MKFSILVLVNLFFAITNIGLGTYWLMEFKRLRKRENFIANGYAEKRIRELEYLAFRYAKHDQNCVRSTNPSYMLPCSCGLQDIINRPFNHKEDRNRPDYISPSMAMAQPFVIKPEGEARD